MKKITIECDSCMGSYDINHNMDPERYEPGFCPFCGEEIDLEYNSEEWY